MKPNLVSALLLVSSLFIIGSATAEESSLPPQKTKITLGSCNRQNYSQSFWQPITAEKSELFLYLGDTIYSDTDDMQQREQQREGEGHHQQCSQRGAEPSRMQKS